MTLTDHNFVIETINELVFTFRWWPQIRRPLDLSHAGRGAIEEDEMTEGGSVWARPIWADAAESLRSTPADPSLNDTDRSKSQAAVRVSALGLSGKRPAMGRRKSVRGT